MSSLRSQVFIKAPLPSPKGERKFFARMIEFLFFPWSNMSCIEFRKF